MKPASAALPALLLALPFGAGAWAQEWSTYSTSGNPQNQGVSLSVEYPGDYKEAQGMSTGATTTFAHFDFGAQMESMLSINISAKLDLTKGKGAGEGGSGHDLCSIPDSEFPEIIAKMKVSGPVSASTASLERKTANGACGLHSPSAFH
jgi:hypothetical protein